MPNPIRTTGSSSYKAIPDPVAGDDSLYHAVVALKEVVEVLTRQRKPLLSSAVTFQDLVDYGIIGADGRALQDNGRLMNELSSASDAGVLDGGALLVVNDLSDVSSAATARTNLGIATVGHTGAYSDLTGKPTLGTAASGDIGVGVAPVPTSSTFPIGFALYLFNQTGSTINNGSTGSGASLNILNITGGGAWTTTGVFPTGTWKNISGSNIANSTGGLFVRTA